MSDLVEPSLVQSGLIWPRSAFTFHDGTRGEEVHPQNIKQKHVLRTNKQTTAIEDNFALHPPPSTPETQRIKTANHRQQFGFTVRHSCVCKVPQQTTTQRESCQI